MIHRICSICKREQRCRRARISARRRTYVEKIANRTFDNNRMTLQRRQVHAFRVAVREWSVRVDFQFVQIVARYVVDLIC
jgi:Spy/CpxP family protein refolding chaperone